MSEENNFTPGATLLEMDYTEIEKRLIANFGTLIAEQLVATLSELDTNYSLESFALTPELLQEAMDRWMQKPEFKAKLKAKLRFDKATRQHLGHPTERNPRHPRFQSIPTSPSKRFK